MIDGHQFLYQPVNGTVYHVSEEGVDVVKSWSTKETIVAFVDGDEEDYKPDEFLRRRSVQLIIASSPKGSNMKWIKQLGPYSSFTRLVVNLWSQEELLITGLVLGLLSKPD